MATYAVGDVQGCLTSLMRLLDTLRFKPERDQLWLTGDLINRGPDSLGVLRFVRGLGASAVAVLGNHDLHLLARAAGVADPKPLDTLDAALAAPDATELLNWLAARPLLHQDRGLVMVHAGLAPAWTVADAAAEAKRLEAILRDPARRPTVLGRAGADPSLKALTTLRTCKLDGEPCKYTGVPAEAPPGCMPWFSHPARRSRGTKVVFGHWAAMGLALGEDYACLDTGCVWGRELTALNLDTWQIVKVPAAPADRPRAAAG
jgi:bis(5'-nucleosyl)-tetraphosphatase (symmetrical)